MALEQELKVGDILMGVNFKTQRVGGAKEFVSVGVEDRSFHVKRVTERTVRRVLRKTTVEESEVFKIDFRWLPWADGKVNWASLEGRDVLSGFFTGCWMALYHDQNFRVAHIATGDKDCVDIWHNAAHGFNKVKAFLPHLGSPNTTALGLVTSNKNLYKIFLDPVENVAVHNTHRTVEAWMDPARNKHQVRSFAERMAKEKFLSAKVVYGGQSYRITKIQGPMAPEPIPHPSDMASIESV